MSAKEEGQKAAVSIGEIRITPQLNTGGMHFLVFLNDNQGGAMSMDEVVNLFNRQGIAFQVWSRIIRGILDSDVPEEIKVCFRRLITVALYPPVRVSAPSARRRSNRR